MQIVRNIKTGLEFAATPDLVKFAKNPRNNLEVIEVEETDPTKLPDESDEKSEPQPPVDGAQQLPLVDAANDDFPAPPAKSKK